MGTLKTVATAGSFLNRAAGVGTSLCPLSPTGQIPAWLQGTLLRNGPGMHTVGESRYNHWFDGLALIHSFTFRDGERPGPGSAQASCVWVAGACWAEKAEWVGLPVWAPIFPSSPPSSPSPA